MSAIRRLLMFMLVAAWLLPTSAAGDARSADRLAGLVSRDSKVFIWVADRSAFLRRVQRTSIVRALSGDDGAEFRTALGRFSHNLSLFVPSVLLDAVPEVLSRGHGAVALSVEGFVLERGRPHPDVLFIAESQGLEGIVATLASANSAEAVLALDLPFSLAKDAAPSRHTYRGVTIVALRTSGGYRVVLAEHDGLLFGARTVERVKQAIDRAVRGTIGSLKDSARFTEAWRQIDPEPGAMVWYANLRRLRQEEAFLLVRQGWARDFFLESLQDYDGMALAVRGVSERLRMRVYLEGGSSGAGGPTALGGGNRPFALRSVLPVGVSAYFGMRASSDQAGMVLAGLNRAGGGFSTTALLTEEVSDLLSGAAGLRLARSVGGEFAVLQPVRSVTVDPVARLAFVLESNDPRDTAIQLARLSVELGRDKLRLVEVGDRIYYELNLPKNGHLARPAFTVFDRWLVGGSNIHVLKAVIRSLERPGARLDQSLPLLNAFDDLDRTPGDPGTGLLFLNSLPFARATLTWQVGMLSISSHLEDEEAAELAGTLFAMLTHPDVEEALHGLLFRVESRGTGVLIEAVGP